jgi:hypothetical protein
VATPLRDWSPRRVIRVIRSCVKGVHSRFYRYVSPIACQKCTTPTTLVKKYKVETTSPFLCSKKDALEIIDFHVHA